MENFVWLKSEMAYFCRPEIDNAFNYMQHVSVKTSSSLAQLVRASDC